MIEVKMDCYEVREDDNCGVSDIHVCYVSDPTLAEAVCAKQKGYRHYKAYKKLYTVFDTMEEIEANTKEALRKSALAKLTTAEKLALGFQ